MFQYITSSISKFGYYLLVLVFALMFILSTTMAYVHEPVLLSYMDSAVILLTICALGIVGAIIIYD